MCTFAAADDDNEVSWDPMKRRIVLAGIIGRYPVGGVAWCALHYIAGLQDQVLEVFYLEDTGECGFDPVANGISNDPAYALRYIRAVLKLVDLDQQWAYIDYRGIYHGKSREEVTAVCRSSEAMINLSGGTWFARPEYDGLRKIFIDTDPGFTQGRITDSGVYQFFASQDALFTFATNVGRSSCTLPPTPFQWHPTVQPVALRFWPVVSPPPGAPYTAILSWKVENIEFSDGKAGDILRMIDLPKTTAHPIVLAIAGHPPTALLRSHSWNTVDAMAATISPSAYQEFIRQSRGELGFAKSMYVQTNSGWISDRTQCYLATGRPCLVRDTGSTLLPTGEGLLTFRDADGVRAGLAAIEADYERHGRRARELAEAYFSTDVVIPDFLDRAGLR